MNKIIAASILSADLANLGADASAALTAGASWLHFDVMDNHFVPNLTFGPAICNALRNYGITAPIDVHLMATPVDSLITEFAKCGATNITIHPEATDNLASSLELIKNNNCKAGIAINPATSLDIIDKVTPLLDLIILMSVNPGFAGQKFIDSTFTKIAQAKKTTLNTNIKIAIDGGVTLTNISKLAGLGIDIFVAGTSIFHSDNYANTISQMHKLINDNL